MQSTQIEEVENSETEEESLTLIEEIEDFISDIDYFISYALSISASENLPNELRTSVEELIFNAFDIRELYQSAYKEKLEDLEMRDEAICQEMDNIDEAMRQNESMLDHCLIYIDDKPEIKPRLHRDTIFIYECGLC